MVGHVVTGRHQLKIPNPVVGFFLVAMVNYITLWDRSVVPNPYQLVEFCPVTSPGHNHVALSVSYPR